MAELGETCEHGSLARQCLTCEMENGIVSLNATIDTLREQLRDAEKDSVARDGVIVGYQDQLTTLREQLAEAIQAIGLVTTQHPTMEMDPDNPVSMMQNVIEYWESHLAAANKRADEAEATLQLVLESAALQLEAANKRADDLQAVADYIPKSDWLQAEQDHFAARDEKGGE